MNIDSIPESLRALPQWVAWRLAARPNGKPTKIPISPHTLKAASSTDPLHWGTLEQALEMQRRRNLNGVGFIFAEGGNVTGIDLDGCISESGELSPEVLPLLANFSITYAEITPSKRGIHIILSGTKRQEFTKCVAENVFGCKQIEIYSKGRYFTFTGDRYGSAVDVFECQHALDSLCAAVFPDAIPLPPEAQLPSRPSAPPKSKPMGGEAPGSPINATMARTRYFAYLKRLPEAVSGQGGSAKTLQAAADGYRFGLDDLVVWEGLQWFNVNKCPINDQWSEQELKHKLSSAKKLVESSGEFGKLYRSTPVTKSEADELKHTAPALIPLGERDPEDKKLVLSSKKTLPTAVAYVKEFHTHDQLKSMACYADQLFSWRGNHYRIMTDSSVRKRLQHWLHDAKRYVAKPGGNPPELQPFESNDSTISSALKSIRDYSHIDDEIMPPTWLSSQPGDCDPLEIMVCKSLSVHIPTRQIIKSTPRLFATSALDFDYAESASIPDKWLRFLAQLWPNDLESIEALQDWFGYVLTQDTRQQKMLLMVGPKRSGKGTIGRVLRNLIGMNNVVGPTISSLTSQFGLQPLIGKSLAIVSDARFAGENISTVIERVLCISGEDSMSIDRKFMESVTMRLPTRFMFLSNEIPRLTDASGALAGRFVILRLTKSFYGVEDHALESELIEELPGILLWAMQGWERLRLRGRFHQPSSVADVIEELEDLSSPVGAFVREFCIVAPGQRIWADDLYLAWQGWCNRDGRTVKVTRQTFGRDLAAAQPGVSRRRASGDIPFYEGIDLKPPSA